MVVFSRSWFENYKIDCLSMRGNFSWKIVIRVIPDIERLEKKYFIDYSLI